MFLLLFPSFFLLLYLPGPAHSYLPSFFFFLSLALPVSLTQSGRNFRGIRLAWLIGGRWQTKGKRATASWSVVWTCQDHVEGHAHGWWLSGVSECVWMSIWGEVWLILYVTNLRNGTPNHSMSLPLLSFSAVIRASHALVGMTHQWLFKDLVPLTPPYSRCPAML